MRILLVAWEYPPVIEGGLGRHVFKLSEALAADGHEVHVLTRDAGRPETVQPESSSLATSGSRVWVHPVSIPPFSRDMGAFMAWVRQLNERLSARGGAVIEEYRFDVVHSHDWMVAAAAQRLAATAACPWLVTVHATEFGRHNGWVHTRPQRDIHLTERQMVRTAAHVICCSEYMAGHVRRVFGVTDGQVSAIPNGIDAGALAPAPGTDLAALRLRYAAPQQRLVLLVGRLVYEKGFHLALDALAALDPPAVRFVVAGTGTAEADLHAQAQRLGLLESGTFVGRVDDDLLHALYRVADVAIVPSLYEPFGIVPLEAMATGCPVIVADTGGLREVVADAGAAAVTFGPGNAGELAAQLSAVLRSPARRAAMREAGYTQAARFDWSAVAAETEDVYDAVLASRTEPLGV